QLPRVPAIPAFTWPAVVVFLCGRRRLRQREPTCAKRRCAQKSTSCSVHGIPPVWQLRHWPPSSPGLRFSAIVVTPIGPGRLASLVNCNHRAPDANMIGATRETNHTFACDRSNLGVKSAAGASVPRAAATAATTCARSRERVEVDAKEIRIMGSKSELLRNARRRFERKNGGFWHAQLRSGAPPEIRTPTGCVLSALPLPLG